MNYNLRMASDFYRVARGKKPAAKILMRAVLGMILLAVWAALTPIRDTVIHSAKIVPRNGITKSKDGSLNPGTPLSGRVSEVTVSELQVVRKGDVLIRLDSREFLIRRKAELDQAEILKLEIDARTQQIKLATETYQTEKAELLAQLNVEKKRSEKLASERSIKIRSSKSQLQQASKERSRFRTLIAQRAISQSELDATEANYQRAKEELALSSLPLDEPRVAELESCLDSLDAAHKELIHKIKSESLALQNRIATARSEVDLLDLKIEQCDIVAPMDGHVSTCAVSVGDWVTQGTLDIVVSQSGFIVETLLPSRSVGNVKIGDRAKVNLDGIDWMINGSINATVSSISPELCHEEVVLGDGSALIVDGYRVLLQVESNDDFRKWDSVRIGMTGSVQIETGKKKLAVYLIEKAVGDALFPTH